jgi:ribosome-associated protein YbcJ (S4-like RNA binding protein)
MNKDCCIEKNGATEKRKTRKTRVGVVVVLNVKKLG